jgi:hypothetical protein
MNTAYGALNDTGEASRDNSMSWILEVLRGTIETVPGATPRAAAWRDGLHMISEERGSKFVVCFARGRQG